MVKPIILAVDDEPTVLRAVERDLRAQYGSTYQIMKAGSGVEALKLITDLKARNAPIALFLVDQRMPDMGGTDLLREARKLYPDTLKVLLTAYADTEAAIASINQVGLNYYLMKPWDPPEQNLYPVLGDLLTDWTSNTTLPYDGIRVAGTLWSASSHTVKDFLGRNRIPFQWLDIEKDSEALRMVDSVQQSGERQLPIIFFPDGLTLIAPNTVTLAEKVGLQIHATQPLYDLIIIGAGPAGLGAAVYGASEGLRTLVIEKEATGGQAGTSSRIENYLGFPNGVAGAELAQRATIQAKRLGAEILTAQEAVRISMADPNRVVHLSNGIELITRSVLIATGVSLRRLDLPNASELTGAGIYYGAALTEAAHYQGEHIFVVGGANSAGQGALFFSRYARQVTMLVRGNSLKAGMSQYLVDQIAATPNIDVRLEVCISAVHGTDRLTAITVEHMPTGTSEVIPTPALFLFIGAVAHTDLVANLVERNEAGFIITGSDLLRAGRRPANWTPQRDPYLLETSVPGIFAAGDVRHDVVRRVASAVGQGAIAVSLVHQYLKTI